MNSLVLSAVFGILVAAAASSPVVEDEKGHNENLVHPVEYTNIEDALMKKLNAKCTSRDVTSCLMLKAITYFNRLLKKSQIEFGDLEITKTSTVISNEEISRSFGDSMSEEAQITQLFAEKAWNFVRTRSLKWKVLDEAEIVISGNGDNDGALNIGLSLRPTKSVEGDARKKKNNGMGAIIAAAALKIGLLKALALKALALLVGKALLVSKLALVLAAIIGLKKLFHQEKHVTYEVVAHPHHETHHEHSISSGGGHDSYGGGGGGGWGRTFDGNQLAYRAHDPSA